MAKVLTDNKHYSDIADAIRAKNGTEDTYKPSEMAAAIGAIEAGGAELPEEAFIITGDCSYRFANGGWDWFLEEFGDRVTTAGISNAEYMFNASKITEIPFDINFVNGGCDCKNMFNDCDLLVSVPSIDFKQTAYKDCDYMFAGTEALTNIGSLKNLFPSTVNRMFSMAEKIRHIPEFINLNLSRIRSYTSASCAFMFGSCYSLRSVPEEFLKQFYGIWTSSTYTFLSGAFAMCYSLDEVVGLNPQTGTITSNMFGSTSSGTFSSCHRLKNIIFATQDDGTPYTVKWKSQTIDLSTRIGNAEGNRGRILNYNSGITGDKEVVDDITYQALKNDPDWFTCNIAYSRYNHDSAVATINSLPDTSAYLASAGGTNTIKFKGAAGSATDGGAIDTLTEEEIAVATAKGWTVTLS